MTLGLRNQGNGVARSFIVGVFVSALTVIILMPATVSAGWFSSKKVIDTRKDLPSGRTASLGVKYTGYAYDYGDSAKGFPGIEVFVICAACGKSLALERLPAFPPISIRVPVLALPGGGGTKSALLTPVSPSSGNETPPVEKADSGPEGAGKKEQGMPLVPAKEQKTSCVLTTIYFRFDSDVIRNLQMEKIRRDVLDQLKGKRDMKISVKGYTCEIGTKQYNDKLAVRRAEAVAKVLEKEGIHPSEVSGEGKCCYVSNELPRNRRSEVVVQPEEAAAAGLRCQNPPTMK